MARIVVRISLTDGDDKDNSFGAHFFVDSAYPVERAVFKRLIDTVEDSLKGVNSGRRVRELEELLNSKNAALRALASPDLWGTPDNHGAWKWFGSGKLSNPSEFAKREAEAGACDER